MKKSILFVAVLAIVSMTSCKKMYECTCTSNDDSKTTYTAIVTGSQATVDALNDAQATYEAERLKDETVTVTTLDKTSKAAANAACSSNETTTNTDEYKDNSDFDSDGNTKEAAYSSTTTWTSNCELAKTK